jgi:hypothetical protein
VLVVPSLFVENVVLRLVELVVLLVDVTVVKYVVLVAGIVGPVTVTITWFTCWATGVAVTWTPSACRI